MRNTSKRRKDNPGVKYGPSGVRGIDWQADRETRKPPEKDKRKSEVLPDKPHVICPECQGSVPFTKAPYGDAEAGIRHNKTLVYSQHRRGGGGYSVKRGDLRCPASYMPVPEEDLPEA